MANPRVIRRLASILLGILLAGCVGAPSSLAPASPNARVISHLMWTIFGIAAFVFVVVEGLLLYAALRFRHKGGNDIKQERLPDQIEGNTRLETSWTLAPAVVLAILFVISTIALYSVVSLPDPAAAGNAPTVHVQVIGHQWWWEFRYPDLGIVTANEYHVPVNSVVRLTVESADVIHSYWAPQLGGKIDVIPGHINQTWFKVTEANTYSGQCAEYCGAEHAEMRFTVVAESPEQFQAWVKAQQASPAAMAGEAAAGEQLFMKSACIGCHTINGTNARGQVGPNLTHLASRKNIAGGVLENTPQNLAAWIANPPGVKPGVKMPNLGLTPDQINTIVAYLESLK